MKIKNQRDLENKIMDLYLRHQNQSESMKWNFYEYMPWEKGQSFTKLPYDSSQNTLPKELIVAIETSMLTELNLPWYTTFLTKMFTGTLEPLQNFVRTWVSEEDQHASALETYLILTRNADPNELTKVKKEIMTTGWDSILSDPFASMVYTSLQELGTVVFYRNIAKYAENYDLDLTKILLRIAKDESSHYVFYNQVVDAHLELNPDLITHVWPVIRNFKMPGGSLKDFDERMKAIQKVGYGSEEYVNQVLDVLIKRWKITKLEPKTLEGKKAKENILKYVEKLKRINAKLKKRN
uniref:Fatty acid desaturase n=1 Tax=Hirondellea gigas TaxID=1518452 RepID=A0A6A7GA19_9CRUS